MITDPQLHAALGGQEYELRLLAAAYRAEANVYPDYPAASLLRRIAADKLPWDRTRRTCWDDPHWVASFEFLKAEFLEHGDGVDLYARETAPLLQAISDRLSAITRAEEPDEPRE